MIDWIDKLPDSVVGIALAALAWGSFNYAVLGARALERYGHEQSGPACLSRLNDRQASIPAIHVPSTGVPEFDVWIGEAIDAARPRLLSQAEMIARCECAVAETSATMRLDYALHTASFRMFTPESIAGLRSGAVKYVMSGACGPIPQIASAE